MDGRVCTSPGCCLSGVPEWIWGGGASSLLSLSPCTLTFPEVAPAPTPATRRTEQWQWPCTFFCPKLVFKWPVDTHWHKKRGQHLPLSTVPALYVATSECIVLARYSTRLDTKLSCESQGLQNHIKEEDGTFLLWDQ